MYRSLFFAGQRHSSSEVNPIRGRGALRGPEREGKWKILGVISEALASKNWEAFI